MEVAAVPLLTAILLHPLGRQSSTNGFVVRKERKTYGTGSLIEGSLTDQPIIIVDDIFNSGRSLEKVRVVLEQFEKTISLCFALIDFESPAGQDWRRRHAIPVRAAFSLRDFSLDAAPASLPPQLGSFRDVWSFASPDPNFSHRVPKSFPLTDGERVYFGSDSGVFWCLDALSGAVLWSFRVRSTGHKNLWSAPALDGGRIFFGSYDGNVYCVDSRTGAEIWRFTDADWVGSSPALAPSLGLLYIGLEYETPGQRGSIVALNLHTGEKVWEYATTRYTHASPAFWPERQIVACGSNNNEMLLLDATSGRLLWRFETDHTGDQKGSIRHAPAFDTERAQLITGCANGFIYILDVATGKELWSVRTGNTIYTVPLVVGDTAYVGSTDKYLYVLDLEAHTVKARIYAHSKIFAPPRLVMGSIFFGASNGMIYELDPATLRLVSAHQLPDAVTNPITYSPETNLFYALTYMNQLFTFTRHA